MVSAYGTPTPLPQVGATVWLVSVSPEAESALDAACFAAAGMVALCHVSERDGGASCADVILEDGSEAERVPLALLAAAPTEYGV